MTKYQFVSEPGSRFNNCANSWLYPVYRVFNKVYIQSKRLYAKIMNPKVDCQLDVETQKQKKRIPIRIIYTNLNQLYPQYTQQNTDQVTKDNMQNSHECKQQQKSHKTKRIRKIHGQKNTIVARWHEGEKTQDLETGKLVETLGATDSTYMEHTRGMEQFMLLGNMSHQWKKRNRQNAKWGQFALSLGSRSEQNRINRQDGSGADRYKKLKNYKQHLTSWDARMIEQIQRTDKLTKQYLNQTSLCPLYNMEQAIRILHNDGSSQIWQYSHLQHTSLLNGQEEPLEGQMDILNRPHIIQQEDSILASPCSKENGEEEPQKSIIQGYPGSLAQLCSQPSQPSVEHFNQFNIGTQVTPAKHSLDPHIFNQ